MTYLYVPNSPFLPGAEFVDELIVSTWCTRSPTGAVAPHVLIGHGARRQNGDDWTIISRRLTSLAKGLGLRRTTNRGPVVEARLDLERGRPTLDYGHDRVLLALPDDNPRWRIQAARVGCAAVTLVLDPLRLGMKQPEVEDFLHRATAAQRTYRATLTVKGRR
ncbi:hypothetical protein A8W25_28205 [Streptomyces sp. ERV7]|uniref:hypothetical protein n=1 Tax=Streptomyces sp. ERV7 TaxID=1322334 RepID=UPI0007F34C63|nr:hypothetical protein [Streptomyces sp. ERV7]OAR21928.1 hypothetical protein A8W25_28205 [Streptomyces sp. ERV7]